MSFQKRMCISFPAPGLSLVYTAGHVVTSGCVTSKESSAALLQGVACFRAERSLGIAEITPCEGNPAHMVRRLWNGRTLYMLAPGLSLVYTAGHVATAHCVMCWCGYVRGWQLDITLCLARIEYRITKFGFQMLQFVPCSQQLHNHL